MNNRSINRKKTVASADNRRIVAFNMDSVNENVQYPDNSIHTGKYNLLTFIPKNLFEQFRRLANFFFLMIVILQCFPEFSLTSPLLAALPITVIVAVTAIKDGIEDFRRHQSDRLINFSKSTILRQVNGGPTIPKISISRWIRSLIQRPTLPSTIIPPHPQFSSTQHIQLSTFNFKAFDDSFRSGMSHFPSFMSYREGVSTEPQNTNDSPTHTDISNYTPDTIFKWTETNWRDIAVGDIILLKNNDVIPADVLILSSSESDSVCFIETKNLDGETNLKARKGPVECSWIRSPSDLARFKFSVECEPPGSNMHSVSCSMSLPLDMHEILVTGDSKSQWKNIPVTINEVLFRGCTLRNTEWVIGAVLYTGRDTKLIRNSGKTPSKRSLIEKMMNIQVLINFGILFILCASTAISFSLTTASSKGIFSELSSGNSEYKSFLTFWACMILFQTIIPISLYVTSEIVKMAQAYFIHNDIEMYYEPLDARCIPKTWTISDDLGQIEYVFSDKTGTLTQNVMEFKRCSIGGVMYGTLSTDSEQVSLMQQNLRKYYENPYLTANSQLVDLKLVNDMYLSDSPQSKQIHSFFMQLSICHTVLSEIPDVRSPHNIIYKAQSPDEAALVSGARNMGFVFLKQDKDRIKVNYLGEEMELRILNVIEFTSSRRRMSMIFRSANDQIVMYTKGADSVIFERLHPGQENIRQKSLDHLKEFATEGLRTLCFAYRYISDEEYKAWAQRYSAALNSITDRETEIEKVANELEQNLELVGASAIEDKLQDGVPDAIEMLLEAGIKIWVLTGDKMETAINIGMSCKLVPRDATLILVDGTDFQSVQSQLCSVPFHPESRWSQNVLVIDGKSLKYALEDQNKEKFLEIACECCSVICCRVSPLQKAEVVRAVKKGKGAMTLAIGDGANDVSMIQQANIGVGIMGVEGRQAVMASDYSIAQFKFLCRLLLVHGKWAYYRCSKMALLMFYKNLVWTVVLFLYQAWSGWTAQIFVDYFFVLFYNVIYTGVPPIVLGVFDKDLKDKISLKYPQLYMRGIKHELYGYKLFLLYVLEGIYQGFVCFFICYFAIGDHSFGKGIPAALTSLGTTAAMMAILNANIYMAFDCLNWTVIHFLSFFGIPLIIFSVLSVYSQAIRNSFHGIFIPLLGTQLFWLCLILSIAVCQLPRIIIKAFKQMFAPSDFDIVREIQSVGAEGVDERPYIEAIETKCTSNSPVSPVSRQQSIHSPSFVSQRDGQFDLESRLSGTQKGYDGASSILRMSNGEYVPITGYAFSQQSTIETGMNVSSDRGSRELMEYRLSLYFNPDNSSELRTRTLPSHRSHASSRNSPIHSPKSVDDMVTESYRLSRITDRNSPDQERMKDIL